MIFVLTLAALGACRAPYRSTPPVGNAAPGAHADPVANPGVTAAPSTAMTMQTSSADSSMEPRDGSRMYLLDLYQKAMDDKDALVLEVQSMQAAFEHEESVRKAAEVERDALAMKLQAAEQREEGLRAELKDLVARLTTAQIRRLEAEKMLLESKIDAHKSVEPLAPKRSAVPPAKDVRKDAGSEHKP